MIDKARSTELRTLTMSEKKAESIGEEPGSQD